MRSSRKHHTAGEPNCLAAGDATSRVAQPPPRLGSTSIGAALLAQACGEFGPAPLQAAENRVLAEVFAALESHMSATGTLCAHQCRPPAPSACQAHPVPSIELTLSQEANRLALLASQRTHLEKQQARQQLQHRRLERHAGRIFNQFQAP
jgi:GAF domain-containing protein